MISPSCCQTRPHEQQAAKPASEIQTTISYTTRRDTITGDGPRFLKVSGKVLYRLEDIEAFEAAQLRSRTDERPVPTVAQPFRPKRGKRRNHVTLAWPPVSGDRRRGLPR